jgi:hypothetical protein
MHRGHRPARLNGTTTSSARTTHPVIDLSSRCSRRIRLIGLTMAAAALPCTACGIAALRQDASYR